MPGMETVGRWLIIFGIGLALLGGLVWLTGKAFPNMTQFPGTIRIQGSGWICVIPILGSILLSIILTIVLNVVARMMK
jgi:hypothetical protein